MTDRLRGEMPLRTLCSTLLLAGGVVLSGCSLTTSGDATPERIEAGESFGECLGYCQRVLEMRPLTMVQREFGYEIGVTLPDRMQERSLEAARWHRLSALVDEDAFLALDSVYGCPDCADGGAEWLEFTFGDRTRRVTFEFGHPPAPIERLTDSLRAIRRSFTYD